MLLRAPTTDTPAQGALVYPADWGVRITSWLATVNAPRLRCRVSPQDSSSGSLDLQHDTLPGCQTDQGDARTSATVLPHMGAAARVMEPATPPTMKTASTANSAQTQQRMHGALVIALGAYLVGPAAGAGPDPGGARPRHQGAAAGPVRHRLPGSEYRPIRSPGWIAALRRVRAGHPPLGQERFRGRPPAGAQPLPGRRCSPVGVLQPHQKRLGARILRRQDRRREKPSRRAASPEQPLAGVPVALPDQACSTTKPCTSPTATGPSATPPDTEVDRGCLTCSRSPVAEFDSQGSMRRRGPATLSRSVRFLVPPARSRPSSPAAGASAQAWCDAREPVAGRAAHARPRLRAPYRARRVPRPQLNPRTRPRRDRSRPLPARSRCVRAPRPASTTARLSPRPARRGPCSVSTVRATARAVSTPRSKLWSSDTTADTAR